MTIIGVIGPNVEECSKELYEFGIRLGHELANPRRAFVCGGMGGFMEAVCKGVKESAESFPGQTIGILPGADSAEANPFVDIAIPTGMGTARNVIIINTSRILIAAGGGAGTLSELAFAWQRNKKVLCMDAFGGWASKLAGKTIDKRAQGLLIPMSSLKEVSGFLLYEGL
jgi:uncharacterized protein (TIGR00725 family)